MALPAASGDALFEPMRPTYGRLLTTKLTAPRLRASTVARPDLLDLITRADAPVIHVCAPAGYGKSTLVSLWLMQSGLPCAWVSLDQHDNDPRSFFSLVAASIETIDRSSTIETRTLLDDALEPSPQAVAHALLRDLEQNTRPFALVLDDYHVIEDPSIHDAVATLLATLPLALKVFLIARSETPLPLERLRGRQHVFELGPHDLRFTDNEALELLQHSNGLAITFSDVGQLNDRAEGWPAGLQLVGHVLRGQSATQVHTFTTGFSGNVRSIENYLWEEAIGQQPAEIKEFLLQTSILDQFSAGLCDAVTGRPDSARVIRRLEHERLFVVPLDEAGRWHRYHHLFVDVLRDRLIQALADEDVAELHRRAAAWLEDEGLIQDAASHAVAGRDWDRAIRLLERVAIEFYETDRNRTQFEWLKGLPDHVLKRSPQLAFYLAFALIRLGRLPEATGPARTAEAAWTLEGDPHKLGLIRMLYALRSMVNQDPGQVVVFARQALDLLSTDRPSEQAIAQILVGIGYTLAGECRDADAALANARALGDLGRVSWMQFSEMGFSAANLVLQGKLREAAVLLRRIASLTDHTHSIQYQQSQLRLGEILLEWDQLAEAERVLGAVDEICEQSQTATWRGWICLALARTKWARGDTEAAFDELERAIAFGTQTTWTKIVKDARATQAQFWLASGQLPLVRRWMESCDLDPYLPPVFARQFEHLTFVRFMIADKQEELALKVLDSIGGQAGKSGRYGDLVEIEAVRALALKGLGRQPEALAALDRAIALAEQGDYVRSIANEGEAIAPLLRHAAVRGTHRDYARRLLQAIETGAAPEREYTGDSLDALSEREAEVLRLVAAGLPNRAIGQRLFISEKTVKKHLSNILAKLGATNRTQAVDQARRSGLL